MSKYDIAKMLYPNTNVSRTLFYKRLRNGMTFEDAIKKPGNVLASKPKKTYQYKGLSYTPSELSRLTSKMTNSIIPTRSIYNRLHAHWDIERIVTTPLNQKYRRRKGRHNLNGVKVTLNDLYILANGYYHIGISYDSLHDRIFRNWDTAEDAISRPIMGTKNANLLLPEYELEKQANKLIKDLNLKLKGRLGK